MEKQKITLWILLSIIGLFALGIAYKGAFQTTQSPPLVSVSQQEVITVNDEIIADFRIHNPYDEAREYTYALYLNSEKRFEDIVTITPKSNFVFGGQYRVQSPGLVSVTALVYEGEKDRLLKNITYFVEVKAK